MWYFGGRISSKIVVAKIICIETYEANNFIGQ